MNGDAAVLSDLGRRWALNLLLRQIELRRQVRNERRDPVRREPTALRIGEGRLPSSLVSLAALAEEALGERPGPRPS
jgi:hypothetical protein